jgi:hypothetical protein
MSDSMSLSSSFVHVSPTSASSKSSASQYFNWDDERIMQLIEKSLDYLYEHENGSGQQEQDVLQVIRSSQVNCAGRCADLRVFAAKWLVLYYNIISLNYQSADSIDALPSLAVEKEQNKDMLLAWSFLDLSREQQALFDGHVIREIDLIRIDISERLRDASKMLPVYNRLVSRKLPLPELHLAQTQGGNTDDSNPKLNEEEYLSRYMFEEEMLVTISIAPLLGKWSDVLKLGNGLLQCQRDLMDFHMASIDKPSIPDIKVLFDMCQPCMKIDWSLAKRKKTYTSDIGTASNDKQGNENDDGSDDVDYFVFDQVAESKRLTTVDFTSNQLRWQKLQVHAMRMVLKQANSTDEKMEQKLNTKILNDSEASKAEWNSYAQNPVVMVRKGALLHMMSIASKKVAVVGPMTDDRFQLEGFGVLVMLLETKTEKAMAVHESYDMQLQTGTNPDENGCSLWKGTYTIRYDEPIAEAVFNMEMKIKTLN